MANLDCKQIVKKYLEENGFTGLEHEGLCPTENDSCGCSINDLAPVDECNECFLKECLPTNYNFSNPKHDYYFLPKEN